MIHDGRSSVTISNQDLVVEFESNGFIIVPATKPEVLRKLRVAIRDLAYELLNAPVGDVDVDLNQLHKHFSSSEQATKFRLSLAKSISERLEVGREVFDAFEDTLAPLVGNDVLTQRVPNVVFQPPGNPNPTELHRDAPANSPYEVVVWLPLVDCYGTKSMYLLNRSASEEVLEFHKLFPNDADGFQGLMDAKAVLISVPFGSALLFWSALFHGSLVNEESETRLSLNTRYKSLFAPLGMKDPFRYFQILKTSPLTRLGLDFQRQESR